MTSREQTAVTKVAPAWLTPALAASDRSTELLKQYRVLSRVKIVQGQSRSDLKRQFGEGSSILSPVGIRLERRFRFIPLIFYTEFARWKDIRDKSDKPMVLERTIDPTSEIARRSRSRELRFEPYGDGFRYRYVEHLNFGGVLPDMGNEATVVSFSRGEYQTGTSFCTRIYARKIPGTTDAAPLWTSIWHFEPALRTYSDWNWWGFDIGLEERNDGWIDDRDVSAIQMLHIDLLELFQSRRLIVDLTEDDDMEETVVVMNDGRDGTPTM